MICLQLLCSQNIGEFFSGKLCRALCRSSLISQFKRIAGNAQAFKQILRQSVIEPDVFS